MSQREDAMKFETGRIKALQEERLHIQKKTFTKWMNSFLVKARMEVEDLFTDLADGKKLLKLLEIISGEKLGKPNNGRMRVHKIENVNKSLAFLHTKVRLESIGAEDIVDGNPRLILGLIWTIILRFQIQEIEIDVDEENESSEKKSAKDALLLWCQRKTKGYNNVNIQDFTGSWRSGLGFNALIHSHRPDLIEFERLVPTKHIDNLNNAFDVAERSLGIPRLLDAEDIDTTKPDEKSVLTYVASYYHTFAQMYNKDKSGRRIANIISQIKEADDLKSKYELDGKSLLQWINQTIGQLNSRDFPNNLEGVQRLLQKFKEHITVTKPPKYNEKSEIEANYFIINTRLKELNQNLYVPPEGLLVHDIERAWEQLEKSEYQRELALREEVIRQTNLEDLAARFEKKSLLREGYLKDMIQVLSDPRYGINLAQVEATLKKHEAISADILAREQRCEQLVTMADYLVKEKYHDCDKVKQRADQISRTWGELIGLLDGHKGNLERFSSLMQVIRDIEALVHNVEKLGSEINVENVGSHLASVDELLQTHTLVETEVSSIGGSVKRIGKVVSSLESNKSGDSKDVMLAKTKFEGLSKEYGKLEGAIKKRRERLEDSRAYFQFVNDHEEEDAWVNEKSLVFGGVITCKDLSGALNLIGSHKIGLDEVRAARKNFGKVVERGNELIRVHHHQQQQQQQDSNRVIINGVDVVGDVKARLGSLEGKWDELWRVGEGRSVRLQTMLEAFQFYSDANETDSWITEKRPLVSSSDYGNDEPSAQALLQRHVNLEEEIIAYESDVKGLNSQADKLVKEKRINSISELVTVSSSSSSSSGGGKSNNNGGIIIEEEYVTEQKMVPEEYFEEEVVERTDYKTVTEERAVAQVKALYLFQGQDIEIKKGEVMFLLNKTNADWWNVRKANGEDGFVPANYVKEIEPKVVMVQVRKPEVVRDVKKVKKTRMVLQNVTKAIPKKPIKKSASSNLSTAPNSTTTTTTTNNHQSSQNNDVEPIAARTTRINTEYNEILRLSAIRKKNLQESIKLFQFLRECDDFEKWIVEKKKYLGTSEPNVQVAKRGFEKFLTDLTASNKRVNEINRVVAEEFEGDKAVNRSVVEKVKSRAKVIRDSYDELMNLKAKKEKTLEGALSVELFYRSCEEVIDWMDEKRMQIDTDEWSNQDLKSVQALQRKHTGLERELQPIKEKVDRVEALAESVKIQYPHEQEQVEEKKKAVVGKWEGLVRRAKERKAALENCVGNQIFMEGVKGLVRWGDGVVDNLDNYVMSTDVSSAEERIKAHSDLGDEIKSKSSEFEELKGLGNTINREGTSKDVKDKLSALEELEGKLAGKYGEKTDWLNQVLDLQVFNREADHIDSASRNGLQFLRGDDAVGSNSVVVAAGDLDGVERELKLHANFEKTLVAQDERLDRFVGMGGKLVEAGHFEKVGIKDRIGGVVARKREVKSLAKTRKSELERSLKYHEFNNDVEETMSWVEEKIDVAKDESYKDLTNVKSKVKKHEAFAGELRANEVRIKNINRAGENLASVVPEKEGEIRESIGKLNGKWGELVELSSEKSEKLRQAEAQAGFNKNLESVLERIEGIRNTVDDQKAAKPGDRRKAADAVKKANGLISEVKNLEKKVIELEDVAVEMEKEKHFDSGKIIGAVQDAKTLVKSTIGPVEDLKKSLEHTHAYYSFLHELEVEEAWISEKRRIVEQETVVVDLYQAQTVGKKHKKVEQEVINREGVVGKLVERGKESSGFVGGGSEGVARNELIRNRVIELKKSYEDLKSVCGLKTKKLELTLKSQQFFFDAGEVESWVIEKIEGLGGGEGDLGKDIHSAVKLLTKHKTLELEMDSYAGLVSEMRHMANGMITTNHPDKHLISAKIQGLEDQMALLRKLANEKREKLIGRVHVLEYLSECEGFLGFVEELFGREVESEDYGVDYEHLCLLRGRFESLEGKVEVVNERFKVLDSIGEKLIGEGEDVEGVRKEVREKWNNMLGLMAARETKLHAAGEIHAFNRDVADSLARIQEKLNGIPETVGRDVNSCESMLRVHEGFENDLLALEAQLQVLVDDASRLQSLYPTNAPNIRHEQSVVIDSWNNLQTKATLRKEQLQNAVDFWRFSAEYANLTSFITSLLNTLPSQPKVRDTASSQALMNEHERIRSEIDARSDQFERVFRLGEEMVKDEHPESGEVGRMLGVLKSARGKLGVSWETKKVYLDQLIDLNIFLRDAKGLETSCFNHEVFLGSIEFGENVDECDKSMKRFEAFEKLVGAGQEDKFRVLDSQGRKLVRQDHFDSKVVEGRLVDVSNARANVLALLSEKRKALEGRLKLVKFVRDVEETVQWTDERINDLKYQESVNSGLNLQEKIKKLKKLDAFSAEVAGNSERVAGLLKVGEEVGDVENVRVLGGKWAELVRLVNEFGKDLEEARELLEFTVACEEMEVWVREKESLVSAGDTGRDYEHCVEIIKKLDGVDSGIRVDDGRVKHLNSLADRLMKSVSSEVGSGIEGKRKGLNERWDELKGRVEVYRGELSKALETHGYNRDAEEVNERIGEKLGVLEGLEFGNDLEGVEVLVRRHEMVESQVLGIETRVKELEETRKNLISQGVSPDKLICLGGKWEEVSGACLQRRNGLSSSLTFHKFLKRYSEVKGYFEGVRKSVDGVLLGGNVEEAEVSLRRVGGLRDEVVARDSAYEEIVKNAKRYIVEGHEHADKFGNLAKEIESVRKDLEECFSNMEGKLKQSVAMQKLFAGINELEREIESMSNSSELGENLGAVVVLLRRHGEFLTEFGGIEGKVSTTITQGEKLIPGHYDGASISKRLNELKGKLDRLKSRAEHRSTKLKESYELHKFVLEIHEIESYAVEKLKVAVDDNYSDMCNLQSKIQRHSAFESEVQANYPRLKAVEEKSEELFRGAGEEDPLRPFILEICGRVETLSNSLWKDLEKCSVEKRERLQESYQALLFNQNLEDLEGWMDELEGNLESEDHGIDLEGVESLITKWNHLESEFNHKADVIKAVAKSAEGFRVSNHYMADEITERVEGIKKRYGDLSEPLHIRRENLEETRKYFEFLRDVEEENGWVGERIVGGVDLGANLTQVQSLQKKHNQLESEIISHEPMITSLQTRASQMIRGGHYASEQISTVMQACSEKFQELKDSAAVRRLRLADSLLSQSFYDEANELLGWMSEKREFISRIECRENENVSGLVKRVEAFQLDLEGFKGRIGKVRSVGEELVGREHFDSENIARKMDELGFEYSELQKFVDRKSCKLADCMRFYEFNRGVGDVEGYLSEMMVFVGSEDYGRDVEHVESLIVKFEAFMGNVQENRVVGVVELGRQMIEEGFPEPDKIQKRSEEVTRLWEEFKELAAARSDALQGAKQVHMFDRTADETISWINEKLSVVSSEEYGHDLESIQCLIRRHAVFENDLKPVESKVGEVRGEAERLRGLFVDASEHVNVKLEAVEEAWEGLVERVKGRGDKLVQAEDLQAYVDIYSELMVRCNELVGKVTSGGLGTTVKAAETDVVKNEMLMKEIQGFKGVDEFCQRGEKLISAGHFMRDEISEKVGVLRGRFEYLVRVGKERGELYKENLDLRVFLGELGEVDKWLSSNEGELRDEQLGESIRDVEELIREHEEFVHNLEAQEGRVEGLKRKTLIEEKWEAMRIEEEAARQAEAKRIEKERLDGLKKRELERIAGEIAAAAAAASSTSAAAATSSSAAGGGKVGSKEKEKHGFTTRIGSLVFGDGGLRGRRGSSEPTSPSPSSSPVIRRSLSPQIISLVTPASSPSSQQIQQDQPATLSRSESLRLLNTVGSNSNQEPAADSLTKKPKRTPSFTTRRRTTSFRNKKKAPENLPPVEIEGYLERKHELQAGGKRAAVRSWKQYYVILCGQLMCFFKDQEDFESSRVGSSSPINILGCVCSVAGDYTKRKWVFRVRPGDGSEFLFCAGSSEVMGDWVRKVNFHAGLEPKDQMIMYGDQQQQQPAVVVVPSQSLVTTNPLPNNNNSSVSTTTTGSLKKHYDSTSTDDDNELDEYHHHHHHHRRPKPRGGNSSSSSTTTNLHNAPARSREPIYANEETSSPQQQQQQTAGKPPIPPRSSSIIILESPPNTNKQRNGSSSSAAAAAADAVDNQQYFVHQPSSNNSGGGGGGVGGRPLSVDRTQYHHNGNSSTPPPTNNNNNNHNRHVVVHHQTIPLMMFSPQPQPPPPAPMPRSSTFKPIISNNNNSQQQQLEQNRLNTYNQIIMMRKGSSSSSSDNQFIPISVNTSSSSQSSSSMITMMEQQQQQQRGFNSNNSFVGGVFRGPHQASLASPSSISPRSSGSLPPGLTLHSPDYHHHHHHHHHHNSSSENEQSGIHSSPSPSPGMMMMMMMNRGGEQQQGSSEALGDEVNNQVVSSVPSSSSSSSKKSKKGKQQQQQQQQEPGSSSGNTSSDRNKESVLLGFFKRKKATQL